MTADTASPSTRSVSLGARVSRLVDRWLLPVYVIGVTST